MKDRFKFRACVMRTVPHVTKGAFRLGLRAALEEVLVGFSQRSDVRMARGGSCSRFCQMMLHKPPRGGVECPGRSWRNESNYSRTADGRSCWREVFPMTSRPTTCPHGRHQTDSVEKSRTSQKSCPPRSCLLPESHWKEHRWFQAHWRH